MIWARSHYQKRDSNTIYPFERIHKRFTLCFMFFWYLYDKLTKYQRITFNIMYNTNGSNYYYDYYCKLIYIHYTIYFVLRSFHYDDILLYTDELWFHFQPYILMVLCQLLFIMSTLSMIRVQWHVATLGLFYINNSFYSLSWSYHSQFWVLLHVLDYLSFVIFRLMFGYVSTSLYA